MCLRACARARVCQPNAAPAPEGRAMRVINARETELIINKQSVLCCFLPSVEGATLLLRVCCNKEMRKEAARTWFMFYKVRLVIETHLSPGRQSCCRRLTSCVMLCKQLLKKTAGIVNVLWNKYGGFFGFIFIFSNYSLLINPHKANHRI